MKKYVCWALLLLVCLLPAGCASETADNKQDAIPFAEGQYYAAAYLGYQETEDLAFYAERYLDSDQLPTHYLSAGDYYLVIPRYDGMQLQLYRNDLETSEKILLYEDPDCGPFLLQCNVSDIFADASISLTYEGKTVEFSPFLSLKDGSVEIGAYGLDLTETPGSLGAQG